MDIGPLYASVYPAVQNLCAAARALGPDATRAPAASRPDLLRPFLAAVVDHLVRSANREDPAGAAKRDRAFDSLHEQWLHALRSPDGTLLAAPAELVRFERQVRSTRRRFERELRTAREDLGQQSSALGSRAQKLVSDAQHRIGGTSAP